MSCRSLITDAFDRLAAEQRTLTPRLSAGIARSTAGSLRRANREITTLAT